MSCDVGLAATALIRPLTWEPPYTLGAALEKIKKKKKRIQLQRLGSLVLSLAWYSGLWDPVLLDLQHMLDSIPGPGNSICPGCGHKKQNQTPNVSNLLVGM